MGKAGRMFEYVELRYLLPHVALIVAEVTYVDHVDFANYTGFADFQWSTAGATNLNTLYP
jgi:hypothetical protein